MGVQSPIFSNVHEVADFLQPMRRAGKSLVTTNGCFDLLHIGHVQYLYEAAAFGDCLVVGINGDAGVRRLKGDGRPVQPERERLALVGALRMVDAAFLFHEDDPRAFCAVLKPDVHVKGGDYTRDIIEKTVVEQNGGVVHIVSLLPGRSTTSLITRLSGGGTEEIGGPIDKKKSL